MADFDSNMIKPVDNLQNIIGVAPARRREQRSRRQQLDFEKEQTDKEQVDENEKKNQHDDFDSDAGDSVIDYCA
jgi:hypothetical protein